MGRTEAALQLIEPHNGSVSAVSIGEEGALEALKHALAMGCQDATLIYDPALKVMDSQVTARVLGTAVKKMGDVDLVLVCFSGKPRKLNVLGSYKDGQDIFAALMSACQAVAEKDEQDFPALLRGIAEAYEEKPTEVVEH